MRNKELRSPNKPLIGRITVPGDKSISHRAIIIGSIANGITSVENLLESEDSNRTIDVFKSMGVTIEKENDIYRIVGHGIKGLKQPKKPLYFGNSGTTARLLIGLLASLPFSTQVYGDSSLSKRPMDRVIDPLILMGADIKGKDNSTKLPLTITGKNLSGIDYALPVKSAQVKSAILLAGLLAKGNTTIHELALTRNHTEIMLSSFGARISQQHNQVKVTPTEKLIAKDIVIPGDISSAAFWIVGALIVPNSKITLSNVGLNDTRSGILEVIERMGGSLQINKYDKLTGEDAGDITILYQPLQPITIDGNMIPRLIDEIPIIALLATQINGKTIIKDAKELKIKETDRIEAIVNVLSNLGANITATEDGMIIEGKTNLTGANVSAYGDHRIAMMIVIASLICNEPIVIDDISSINISYPNFFTDLQKLSTNIM